MSETPDIETPDGEDGREQQESPGDANTSGEQDTKEERESNHEEDSSGEEDARKKRVSLVDEDSSDEEDANEKRVPLVDDDSSEEEDEKEKRVPLVDDDSSEEEDEKKEQGSAGEEDSSGEEDEKKEQESAGEEDSSGEDDQLKTASDQMVYDFDIMMAKKKAENSRKRRRRGYDIINDNDDIIADIVNQMKDAVEADIDANKSKQVATSKLKLLPFVINQLRKVDLRDAFLDSDILGVITEWLAPLPDRSLPHLNIRENLLKILLDFNLYDVDRIKNSGIGKAVMYLYKHPRETKENKQRCKQLISAWSRPIFNLDSSFSAISKEEREDRDKELKRRASRTMDSSDGEGPSQNTKRAKEAEPQPAKKPGDEGWVPRARVPAPSMRDYVIRPRSKVDGDIGKGSKRPANILEKLMKTHSERRRANKQQRAINMKIDKL